MTHDLDDEIRWLADTRPSLQPPSEAMTRCARAGLLASIGDEGADVASVPATPVRQPRRARGPVRFAGAAAAVTLVVAVSSVALGVWSDDGPGGRPPVGLASDLTDADGREVLVAVAATAQGSDGPVRGDATLLRHLGHDGTVIGVSLLFDDGGQLYADDESVLRGLDPDDARPGAEPPWPTGALLEAAASVAEAPDPQAARAAYLETEAERAYDLAALDAGDQDNMIWQEAMHVLAAAHALPEVRAGMLLVLASAERVTVEATSDDGLVTLSYRMPSSLEGGVIEQTLTLDPATGNAVTINDGYSGAGFEAERVDTNEWLQR